ncbi:glycosyl transferase [Pedobacter sp. HMF7647]|uniref:Glycosyl transferase n=1 Tax=Hufsiella arboris TaxID=2695275 RepID=A0A7K1YDZ7_9SPHI|nr:glycosyl transferase [Hufsiella arboris]MXV52823.1 glycosyl transferase [Hufsiella arboris]
MFQKLVDKIYREPKFRWQEMNRFGGKKAYEQMLAGKTEMESASYSFSPIKCFHDGLPIYFLTGKKYLYQTLFCLKSLSKYCNEKFCIYLVDDGSFDAELISRVKRQLPGAIIIDSKTIENKIANYLPKTTFPVLNRKRAEYPHIKKLTDVHLFDGGPEFKLVLDSDMLFWAEPEELIAWLKNPQLTLHMVDCMESYGYPKAKLEAICNTVIPDLVNVGAIGLKSNNINWEKLEYWVDELENSEGKSYYLEQALSAMIIGSTPSVVLNSNDYIVNPSEKDVNTCKGTLQHYVDLSKKDYFNIAWKKV